ncbi:hypothetical protein O181_060169 [Austropuccinia psidii MF-1]|uniref:Uncharacterized protein n=1 Tax=Austropuccinia psidii MF-1 TaxID=1389203 RepID=A0A9Q3EFQ5_9BASI|nr:hypothetical protein [Austropuccinia psidii MF-1]
MQEETKWAFLSNRAEPINEDGNKQLIEEIAGIEEFPLAENSAISEMVYGAHSDGLNADSTEIDNQSRIKVIGSFNPTLITSSIDQLNVLPYSRRGNALFSASI